MRSRLYWALLAAAALYGPLEYAILYVPLIVPRLDGWQHFPLWYDLVVVVPPAVLLLAVGFLERQRRILLAAAVVGLSDLIFGIGASLLRLPGHVNWGSVGELIALQLAGALAVSLASTIALELGALIRVIVAPRRPMPLGA